MQMQNEEQEIDAIDEIVTGNIDALCELTQEGFMTFISMAMELYSMRHKIDVTEIAQGVAVAVTLTHMVPKDATS